MPLNRLVRGRQAFEEAQLARDVQSIEQDEDWKQSWDKRDKVQRQLKESQMAKKTAALEKIRANREKRNGRDVSPYL